MIVHRRQSSVLVILAALVSQGALAHASTPHHISSNRMHAKGDQDAVSTSRPGFNLPIRFSRNHIKKLHEGLKASSRSDLKKLLERCCQQAYFASKIGGVLVGFCAAAYFAMLNPDESSTMPFLFAIGAIDMIQDMRHTGKSISEIIDPPGSITGRRRGCMRRFCRHVYGCSKFFAMIANAGLLVVPLTLATDADHEVSLRLLGIVGIPVCASSVLSLWKSFWRGNNKQHESTIDTELTAVAEVAPSEVPQNSKK